MPADWDSSTSQGAVDTGSLSETSTVTNDSDWDTYPDSASSETGNTPEIAHLNQGNPDSPNGWGDYDPADYDQYDEDDWGDDHSETAGSGEDEPDPWGDTYPDAAYPAGSSNDTGRDDGQETLQPDPPAADNGIDNGQADQNAEFQAGIAGQDTLLTPEDSRTATWGDNPQHDDQADLACPAPQADTIADPGVGAEPSRADDAGFPQDESGVEPSSPEAEQLTRLEAERDEAKRESAGLKAENAEQAALIERQNAIIERLLARTDGDQFGDADTLERTSEEPDASLDQGLKSPTIAERKATDQEKTEMTQSNGGGGRRPRQRMSGPLGERSALPVFSFLGHQG